MNALKISISYDKHAAFDAEYSFVDTPYGEMIGVFSDKGLCYLGFTLPDRKTAIGHICEIYPGIRLVEGGSDADIFMSDTALHIIGTPFQIDVWRALTDVARGSMISYSELARRSGHASAVRAAASAVARNPIALLVPCHRIIRNDGAIGKYYWGARMKRRLLEDEGAI